MQNYLKSYRIKEMLLVVAVLCSLVFMPGCGNGGDGGGGGLAMVMATHEPMHPTNTQEVIFKAEAWATVDRVVLAYERYALSTDPNGEHVQTLVEPLTTVETCDPAGTVSSLTCEYTMESAFPANSLISFRATAYAAASGGASSSESYSFAAGDYPWPNDPIPIRAKGLPAERLDVVLIPDTDITVDTLRDNLDEVIETLYFNYEAITAGRGFYNFYYSGEQGNYEEDCNFTDPSNMANLTAVGDVIVILHSTDLRDCRSGNKMSSEIDYDKTLIHETGHALFDLQDEYCCDSHYSPQACVPNLWSSLSDCQADAPNITYPASNCTQLSDGTTTLDFWYIDPTGSTGCIMGDSQHNAGSDFGKACRRRIYWRYGKCLEDCFPSPECP